MLKNKKREDNKVKEMKTIKQNQTFWNGLTFD
jgi:hypothetical protein